MKKLVFLFAILFLSCDADKATEIRTIQLSEEVTIGDIHKAYREGSISVPEVVNFYLDRIDSIDQNGPELKAVLTLNPNALDEARVLEKQEIKGPLYGIPVLIKDNINSLDSMPTTAGSRVMKENYTSTEAFLVKQLKEAGAVILGKTNLSEWANFHSDVSSSGWSGLGGQTNNPYRLSHNPCGSSSGSGVAVAANLCVIAIGTETNGSIVCPSTNNGNVGIKPTVGLISRSGIIPISHHQDTAGPMARSVRDAVIALGTMTQLDPNDSAMQNTARKAEVDYTGHLKVGGIKGKRLGYYSKPLAGRDSELTELMAQTLNDFRKAGAEIIEIPEILDPKTESHSFTVLKYEFKDGLNKYFATLGGNAPVRTLEEVIKQSFLDTVEMKFDHQLLVASNEMGSLNDAEYRNALDSMLLTSRAEGIDRVMKENQLDAIIAPTGGPAWKTDHENGDAYDVYSSSPAAIAGYPNITVPMGFIEDLPVGVSIFGMPYSEGKLIEIAYDYEQLTQHRSSPKYLK